MQNPLTVDETELGIAKPNDPDQPAVLRSVASDCSLFDFFLWVSPIIQKEIDHDEYGPEDVEFITARTLIHKYNHWAAKGRYPQIDDELSDEEIWDRLGKFSKYKR